MYYKGSGTVYTNHLTNQVKNEDCGEKIIGKTGLIYEKYIACYPKLTGRFGIFMFPHQAIFTDYEGGCGKKKQKITENQRLFERTAIDEIIDVIPTGIENHCIYAQLLLNCLGTYSFEKYKILYYSALIVRKYCARLLKTEQMEPACFQ